VSYTVFEACLDPERRSCAPADVAVLLALAAAVNQKDTERGWAWEAWPSQARLAHQLGIGERQVRRRLSNLKAAGDIRETGEIVGRGIRKYEITLGPPRSDRSTLDHMDRGQATPGGLPDEDHPGQIGPVDRSDPTTRPDHMDRDPGLYGPTEPEENRNENQEENQEVARAEARDRKPPVNDFVSGLSPSSTGSASPTQAQADAELADRRAELAECERLIAEGRAGSLTVAAAAELRDELGIAAEVAA
jgi:hypothetical protein